MRMSRKKIHLISLGCPKNLVDSEILIGGLKRQEFEIVDIPEEADAIIVNTCGFIEPAREESIDTILQAAELKKIGNLRELVVMGCFSELYPDELQKGLPEVDYFFGTDAYGEIIAHFSGKDHLKFDPHYLRSLLTPSHYAYLKIAEGCDNECSFCSIPMIRGKQKSRPIKELLDEAEWLADRGVKELILIAQDTTSYGWDLRPKVYLQDLLKELDRITHFKWIRLLYTHPAHLSNKVVDVIAKSDRICHYIDFPIQHVSDRLLTSMCRGLGKDGIRKRIYQLRSVIPNIAIRTSLIVGYPNETEDDFQELVDFVEEIRFDRLGVFTYSEEKGTPAFDLKDDVPIKTKWNRRERIMLLQMDIALEKNSRFVGKTMEVLIDEVKYGVSTGRIEYDSPEIDNIVTVNQKLDAGKFYEIEVTDYTEYGLTGKTI
ncbi:MAG: 30S ribosomal protein S12 methylthiotransferase RimO [Candidatus Marinimicrobia bacterium]|nr:30S ribosomal protein S12 methylthiotransferase RimO [Candidatus Neomarinimicrobiota bacterium]